MVGKYNALDIINDTTGEIYLEAGEELDVKKIEALEAAGIEQISVLDVDHVTIGSYIRNTMVADKNQSREQSLFERSEEHTSELQSLMRISYAVFCLKKKKKHKPKSHNRSHI